MKFTDRKGSITVLVEKEVNYSSPQVADMLIVSIIDSGIGIKDSDQKKLFKMFSAVKDENDQTNTQGIGLGLVISKLIVNKFNGNIDFISKFKEGSTFFYSIELDNLTD